MSNYADETRPLFKLLRTEAFRFVIVRYNREYFIHRLEDDLRALFPDRPLLKADARTADYQEIMDAYFSIDRGFFFLENFNNVLIQDRGARNAESPEQAEINKRKRHITAGLNLRRDKLAKKPIALFIFISADAPDLYARIIMEKMPDLWSFRSLILDLAQELPVIHSRSSYNRLPTPVTHKALDELNRLIRLLEKIPESEIAYRLTLYPQIVSAATRTGSYDLAKSLLEDWSNQGNEEDQISILIEEGNISLALKNYADALKYYRNAERLSRQQSGEPDYQILLKIGETYLESGNLKTALPNFTTAFRFFNKALVEDSTSITHKLGLLSSHKFIGETYALSGNLTQALSHFEEYNRLINKFSDSISDFKVMLASSHEKIGSVYLRMKNVSKALFHFKQAYYLVEELRDEQPDNPTIFSDYAIACSKLGQNYLAIDQSEVALNYLKEANLIIKNLYDLNNKDPEVKLALAISYSFLGDAHTTLGQKALALEYYLYSHKLAKELTKQYPDNVRYKNQLAISYSSLGYDYTAQLDKKRALDCFEKSNRLLLEVYNSAREFIEYKEGLIESYKQLAWFYSTQINNQERADQYLDEAKILERIQDALAW
jgi:tetratricopeptide (TPR) repeat protein